MSAKILQFPVKKSTFDPPRIDWARVEQQRHRYFPQVPKIAVRILRWVIEASPSSKIYRTGQWCIHLNNGCDHFQLHQQLSATIGDCDVMRILEQLDRYGGRLVWGKLECVLNRPSVKPELRLLYPISQETQEAFFQALGFTFEHRVECSKWKVLGKEIEGGSLMIFLIESEGDHFLGLFDYHTARVILDRLKCGHSVKL